MDDPKIFILKDGCGIYKLGKWVIHMWVCEIKKGGQDRAGRDGGGCRENDDPQNGDVRLESNVLHCS